MNYQFMIPPFEIIPFQNMSKKQADQYYRWFLVEKGNRVQLLEQYVTQFDDSIVLDYSIDSLVNLWRWFETQIEWEDKTEDELINERIIRPKEFKDVVPYNKKKLTVLTSALCMDISIYFGEMIIANNPTIYWGYKTSPKGLDGVNRPLLLGFSHGISVFPYTLIQVLTRKSSREKDEKRLYDLYLKWCENI